MVVYLLQEMMECGGRRESILPNHIESGVEIINMKGIPEVAQWVTVTAWILYECGV